MTESNESPAGVVTIARSKAPLEPGHQWIYAGFVQSVSGEPVAGDVVDVRFPNGQFYARGFFNPASKIRVRVLTFDDEPVTECFWRERILRAKRLRELVVSRTNAYRLIYGEADGLPGLIVDRYDDVLVMQNLSAGMDCRKQLLADLLCRETGIKRVYLRNDAKSRALEGLPQEIGFIVGEGST